MPKKDWSKIEQIIIPPPISTLIGGISFINNQAHRGPNTDSVNIKTPTTAAGVVCEPMVIKINPNPIWKKPAKKAKKRSWGEIDNFPVTNMSQSDDSRNQLRQTFLTKKRIVMVENYSSIIFSLSLICRLTDGILCIYIAFRKQTDICLRQ